jgi:O-antigen/teichoic acid export membrane protein
MRFARNVSWSVVGQGAAAVAAFLFTPYLVHHLGAELYGLFLLLNALAGYLMLLTFGAGNAAVKFVAEFRSDNSSRALSDSVKYAFAFHILPVGAGALAAAVGARVVAFRVFHVPEPLLDEAVFVLRCAAAGAFFAAVAQAASCILQGLQRFDWQNAVAFAQTGLMSAGAAAFVAAGHSLRAMACWYIFLNFGACLLAVGAVWRLVHPHLSVLHGKSLGAVRFAGYGVSLWFGSLAWIVTFQLDRLFIARMASLTALTLYAVPAGLLQRLQIFPAAVSTVLIPMMSEVTGDDREETLRRMYIRSQRFLLWLLLPALCLLFALMPQFLSLWLGGEFGARSVWPARLLILAQGFFLLNYAVNSVSASRDHPWYPSVTAWAQALISLAAWYILIRRYQLLGVAMGSLLAQAIHTTAYLLIVHARLLKLSPGRFASEALMRPFLSAGLLLALIMPIHEYASSWPLLFGTVAAGLALFYGAAWALLDHDDHQLCLRLWNSAHSRGAAYFFRITKPWQSK